jgi:hypothetical protein
VSVPLGHGSGHRLGDFAEVRERQIEVFLAFWAVVLSQHTLRTIQFIAIGFTVEKPYLPRVEQLGASGKNHWRMPAF